MNNEFVSQRSFVSDMGTNVELDELEANPDERIGFNRGKTIIGDDIDSPLKVPKPFNTIDPSLIKEDELVCRICLSEEEPGNPIISPCKCIGSVRFIHLKCI